MSVVKSTGEGANARLGQTDTPASNGELVRRLIGLAWHYRVGCIKLLVLQVFFVAMGVSGLGFAGLGIDYVRYEVDAWHHDLAAATVRAPQWPFGLAPPEDASRMLVVGLIGLLVGATALLAAILKFHAVMAGAKLSQQVIVQLRSQVYDKLQRLSFRFYDANESGTIINRVTGDVQSVRLFVDRVLIQVVTILSALAIYLVFMLKLHVGLTLACLASTPLLWLITLLFARIIRPLYLEARELVDAMIWTLSESIQGMHVVKCFGREQAEIDKFNAANRRVHDHRCSIFWRLSLFIPSIGFLTHVNLIILLGYGGYLVIHNRLELGLGLIVFAELLRQFAERVVELASITNVVQRSLTGAQRVFEVLDTPVEIRSAPDSMPMRRREAQVTFDRVSFGYDQSDLVLDDVSFEAESGQCVAILGTTGSGKSTLLSLVPRFYDVTSGHVRINDTDVRKLDVDDLRRNIGLVFQESFLFSSKVADNIAFGHPDASREQIEQAARIAAAHDFITDLDHGYDTVIGENGVDLSGGQRQRLAIARAVLLEPSILIMDDPTAAIDPETEHEILQAMDSAMKDRTTFVVAHRLSTLRRADQIIVLDRGRIVQAGTHAQLMGEKGQYRMAAKLQVADAASKRLLATAG